MRPFTAWTAKKTVCMPQDILNGRCHLHASDEITGVLQAQE